MRHKSARTKRTSLGDCLLVREEIAPAGRLVGTVFPQSHQEIARARHADFLREATQDRLASVVRERTEVRSRRMHSGTLQRATAVVRKTFARRPAVITA
jgi:hypothetical protein